MQQIDKIDQMAAVGSVRLPGIDCTDWLHIVNCLQYCNVLLYVRGILRYDCTVRY